MGGQGSDCLYSLYRWNDERLGSHLFGKTTRCYKSSHIGHFGVVMQQVAIQIASLAFVSNVETVTTTNVVILSLGQPNFYLS
jgi:hypothetical protein